MVFRDVFWLENSSKTHENKDFHTKIIHFDQIWKKNRLAAGPLPGVTLGGEHASGGPLRGGENGRGETVQKVILGVLSLVKPIPNIIGKHCVFLS